MLAIRTPVASLGFSEWLTELREIVTDFAADLAPELAIVEVKKVSRGITMSTTGVVGHFVFGIAMTDGFQRVTVTLFKLSQQLLPICRWLLWRRGLKRPDRVYIEVPVVRMFFLKSSFGFISGLRLARMS